MRVRVRACAEHGITVHTVFVAIHINELEAWGLSFLLYNHTPAAPAHRFTPCVHRDMGQCCPA